MCGAPLKPVYAISAAELRTRFNAKHFDQLLRAGTVFERRLKSADADRAKDFPPNTLSIYSEYVDGRNNLLAEVHYYRQINGNFRTNPDPKMLITESAVYVLDPGE